MVAKISIMIEGTRAVCVLQALRRVAAQAGRLASRIPASEVARRASELTTTTATGPLPRVESCRCIPSLLCPNRPLCGESPWGWTLENLCSLSTRRVRIASQFVTSRCVALTVRHGDRCRLQAHHCCTRCASFNEPTPRPICNLDRGFSASFHTRRHAPCGCYPAAVRSRHHIC